MGLVLGSRHLIAAAVFLAIGCDPFAGMTAEREGLPVADDTPNPRATTMMSASYHKCMTPSGVASEIAPHSLGLTFAG